MCYTFLAYNRMCMCKNLYKNFKINHLWEISPYSELVTQIVFGKIKNLTKTDKTIALSEHSVWFFDLFFFSDNDYCIRSVCLFIRSLSELHYDVTPPAMYSTILLFIKGWLPDGSDGMCACEGGGFVLPLKNSTKGLLRLKGGLCISIIHLVPCILFSTPKKHALTSKRKWRKKWKRTRHSKE